jgi:lipid-A-disaccharide synthase-like uncharacterized protein
MQEFVDWFYLDDPVRRWLIAFGFLGQFIFFARWLIQWIATERRGESHIPELFWWTSLIGSLMLVVYFALDRNLVGTVGQGVGWTVYTRNLYLIKVKKKEPAVE